MKLDNDIHNYYEHLVLERIIELKIADSGDDNFIADLCCLALNQLPPRYIRYEVDMSFYLAQDERQQMQINTLEAINKAIRFLDGKERK
ncbi:MAG: hypothetical protein ACI9C4_002793 [Paraglaciecola sp.]|jgi:hypothetical protein